jgi:hypothetical protein
VQLDESVWTLFDRKRGIHRRRTIDSPAASDSACQRSATRQWRPAATGGAKKELNQTQLAIDGAEISIPGFTPLGMPPAGDDPHARHDNSGVTIAGTEISLQRRTGKIQRILNLFST